MSILGLAVIAGAVATPALFGPAKAATMTQAEQEQAAGDLVAGSVHLKPGGITGALQSAWGVVSPGGLDGVEAGGEYVLASKAKGWIGEHLLVLGVAGVVAYIAWKHYA